MTATVRSAYGASAEDPVVDGYPNFHYLTAAVDGTRIPMSSGINLTRMVASSDGVRRPVLVLRSSPWKAGQESNPWHDIYDLDNGYVRYFGDHKIDDGMPLGRSRGNAALLDAWPAHRGGTQQERLAAPPILLFRSITVNGVVKGYMQFCVSPSWSASST